jgi:hypothetical protein
MLTLACANEFVDLLETGELQELVMKSSPGHQERNLGGKLDAFDVHVRLVEDTSYARADATCRFEGNLGIALEMISTGTGAGLESDSRGEFDRAFYVLGNRDGTDARLCVTSELMTDAMSFLREFGGTLAVRDGGIAWRWEHGTGKAIDLNGRGTDLLRRMTALASRVWEELRSKDPKKTERRGRRPRPAPRSATRAQRIGLVVLAIGVLLLAVGGSMYGGGERDYSYLLLSFGSLLSPIGAVFLLAALLRNRKINRAMEIARRAPRASTGGNLGKPR